jgi:hypothetical protein
VLAPQHPAPVEAPAPHAPSPSVFGGGGHEPPAHAPAPHVDPPASHAPAGGGHHGF